MKIEKPKMFPVLIACINTAEFKAFCAEREIPLKLALRVCQASDCSDVLRCNPVYVVGRKTRNISNMTMEGWRLIVVTEEGDKEIKPWKGWKSKEDEFDIALKEKYPHLVRKDEFGNWTK